MKVRCAACVNEKDKICMLKKIGVKINKPRVCESFSLVEGKAKTRMTLPSVKFGYAEQQEAKRMRKERKEEQAKPTVSSTRNTTTTSAHPLTGDLSRFVSSAVVQEG